MNGNEPPDLSVRPGFADVTLKIKDVDPAMLPPVGENLTERVRPRGVDLELERMRAHLKVKVSETATA
jgi:hypothetical protein